jgi:chemotaxis methyl-accepting protein methylase
MAFFGRNRRQLSTANKSTLDRIAGRGTHRNPILIVDGACSHGDDVMTVVLLLQALLLVVVVVMVTNASSSFTVEYM